MLADWDVLHNSASPPNGPLAVTMLNVIPEALLVVEPLAEARLMLWAIEGCSSEAAAVLREALLRGWGFRVLLPEAHLDHLKTLRAGAHTPVTTHFQILSPESKTGVIRVLPGWSRYKERVLKLLARPHARAFLLQGGLFWRLAIPPFISPSVSSSLA